MSSSTDLILVRPTDEEQVAIWAQGYAEWGTHLTPSQYEARERHLLATSLLRNGGLTPWMLTWKKTSAEGGQRTALASCETLRKRALVRVGDGHVRLVRAEGVASVFVGPLLRRRGYAARMMGLLASRLREEGDVAFSVLYSDIGREFYARVGWKVHSSCHVSLCVPPSSPLPVSSSSSSSSPSEAKTDGDGDDDNDDVGNIKAITDDQLASLAQQDELRLRHKLASYPSSTPSTIRLALIPDLATLQWHFARQDFLSQYIDSLPRQSERPIRGALYESNEDEGSRVWALWTLKSEPSESQSDGVRNVNTLEFLRLSYPDSISQAQLKTGVEAIINQALRQGRKWLCTSIQIWNPDGDRVRPILDGLSHLRPEFVVRDDSSIASLLWLGLGDGSGAEEMEEVDWVANDKFGWC
ncbi:hypothetical protein CP533_2175 [Ophiocordyceps camponoti-saundersi (nom. inval.)]|nr:hypothetical protein CP533_2175 [Ophiocordyceps camponoti-saundersi (nom. inval.)]